jgi:hypothetical protein
MGPDKVATDSHVHRFTRFILISLIRKKQDVLGVLETVF